MTTGITAAAGAVVTVSLSSKRSELVGTSMTASTTAQGPRAIMPSLPARRGLSVVASAGSKKKLNVKNPFGPCGGTKFRTGADASGSKAKGKGVYQFSKKYGANVDGYSPIYAEEEWATSGDIYAGGQAGLALWALTFGALLVAGALLVYNTSALVA